MWDRYFTAYTWGLEAILNVKCQHNVKKANIPDTIAFVTVSQPHSDTWKTESYQIASKLWSEEHGETLWTVSKDSLKFAADERRQNRKRQSYHCLRDTTEINKSSMCSSSRLWLSRLWNRHVYPTYAEHVDSTWKILYQVINLTFYFRNHLLYFFNETWNNCFRQVYTLSLFVFCNVHLHFTAVVWFRTVWFTWQLF